MSEHQGSCHCSKVTFAFEGTIDLALECNCSICRRKGAIWHAADNTNFHILAGQDDLALYQFGTHTAKHYFCRHCGISTFSNPRIAPDRWVVNLRCIDGIDLSSLKVYQFDGHNWEQAVQQFIKARSQNR